MSDHLLHIKSIGEDGAQFRLECCHEVNQLWHGGGEDGTDIDDLNDDCNLASWWDNIGMELFDQDFNVSLPPIPVTADGWGFESPELRVVTEDE